jgi:hypothetical protein
MAENINTVESSEQQSEKPSVGKKIAGGIKEWFRKFIVNLKRRPMNIAFFVLVISTIVNLCILGYLSQLGLSTNYSQKMQGLCIFVNQLFSILVLLLFMNSFPKREKKPKVVMLVLTFVFMAVMIALDVYLYIIWGVNHAADIESTASMSATAKETYWNKINSFYPQAMSGVMAHIILVAIAAVLTATYPLYGKLINKINTRKVVESTELKEDIDTSEEV